MPETPEIIDQFFIGEDSGSLNQGLYGQRISISPLGTDESAKEAFGHVSIINKGKLYG